MVQAVYHRVCSRVMRACLVAAAAVLLAPAIARAEGVRVPLDALAEAPKVDGVLEEWTQRSPRSA